MMTVTLEDTNALIADFRNFPGTTTRAMVRALNRAIASGRTFMVRELARDTGLRSTDLRAALSMREATFDKPEARLATTLKRIPLVKFNARGPEPSGGRGQGVSYRLPSSKGRVPTAFIATMRSGHRGVFVRSSKLTLRANQFKGFTRKRLPIRELFGPSLGHVFAKYRPAALVKLREAFDKNFAHELEFARGQSNGA